MFDRTELRANWRTQPFPLPGALQLVEYGHSDFQPSGEQTIGSGRGAREDFLGPVHFWISAYFASSIYAQPVLPADVDDLEAARIESVLCEPISREQFVRVLDEYSGSLREPQPEFMRDLGGWRGGLRLYDAWNSVDVLAEVDHGYLWFCWGTSA